MQAPAFGVADDFDHLPPVDRLRAIMHRLRAPGGCPWDAEQTHESLLPHLIEEAYEVAEAVRSGDRDAIVDELGDLLLQPVFHAEIASERGDFDLDTIARAIGDKLIRRHPHVFGESRVEDATDVLRQWDRIKRAEKGEDSAGNEPPKPYLGKANEGLPALVNAAKLQKKAARVGFDWPDGDLTPVLGKIREETDEVAGALASGEAGRVAEEIGDLLFAVVNLARKQRMEPELLLHHANAKFVRRFQAVERRLRDQGLSLEAASLEQMDAAWEAEKQAAIPIEQG
ncbi:MAG: nucleoside triphosphate pyrophosphohydrolase [Verrucomicrobiales bacterium]|nr:nucleoside triphosphate pyrophosphohydrolase [Verrucomicrobiales bacterium]